MKKKMMVSMLLLLVMLVLPWSVWAEKAPAVLQFRDAEGAVLLTEADILHATVQFGDLGMGQKEHYVELKLTEEGRFKFYLATARISQTEQNWISIFVDEVEISRPQVAAGIDSDRVVISGAFTAESAQSLAEQISPHKQNLIQRLADAVARWLKQRI